MRWLQELGYEPPPTTIVEVDTRYVSRMYRRTDAPMRDWKAAAVIGDPATKRLAMLLPIEGNRWILAIAGMNGESAPADAEVKPLPYMIQKASLDGRADEVRPELSPFRPPAF